MAEYILLCRFTEKGVANIKESPNRVNAVKKMVESVGGKFKTFYAVLGRYDTVCIIELADDETAAGLSLKISSLGNVHIETLRAFSENQYVSIVGKIS